MWPALKTFLAALIFDETAFLRWARALILIVGSGGLAYAQDVANILGAPTAVERVKKAAVVCMGLSILIGAGDKTPENVKQMAGEKSLADAAKLLDAPSALKAP